MCFVYWFVNYLLAVYFVFDLLVYGLLDLTVLLFRRLLTSFATCLCLCCVYGLVAFR